MKLGIIRCIAVSQKTGAFAKSGEEIELVGFINCGGCPGKKTVLRVRELVRRGADAMALASCISKGTPIGYPCPFAQKMKELIAREAPNIRIIEYTH